MFTIATKQLTRKTGIVAVTTVLAIGAAVSGSALARTIPGNQGTARLGSQANLFNRDFGNGSVTSTGNADLALGLPVDTCGSRTVSVMTRATAVGGAVRAVSNSADGTVLAATTFQSVPVSTAFVQLALGPINVPCSGVLFIDAITANGTTIGRVDYNP
jgi:hypothetical protein